MKELNVNATCTMQNLIDAEVAYMLKAERAGAAGNHDQETEYDRRAITIEETIVKVFDVSRQAVVEAVCETYDDRMKEQIEEQMNGDSFYFA